LTGESLKKNGHARTADAYVSRLDRILQTGERLTFVPRPRKARFF